MNLFTLAGATLALAFFAPQPHLPQTESVTLAWHLSEGATYRVESRTETETNTVSMGQEQEEEVEQAFTFLVHVDEVTDEGNMLLSFTVDAYFMEKESSGMNIEISGERDANGEVSVRVEIDSSVSELLGDDIHGLFEAIGRNSMDLKYEMLLTPQGRVLRSSIDGNPMFDLPTETPMTEMIVDSIASLINPEDLPGALASQIFCQFSDEKVQEGDSWSIARAFSVAGMGMDGEGTCTFDAWLEEDSDGLVQMTESIRYEIDTVEFSENMEDMMNSMMEKTGVEMDISVDLDAEPMDAEMQIQFSPSGGFCHSMSWSDTAMNVSGDMGMSGQAFEIEIESATSGATTWSLVEEKQEDE